jgi:hypothetical protein
LKISGEELRLSDVFLRLRFVIAVRVHEQGALDVGPVLAGDFDFGDGPGNPELGQLRRQLVDRGGGELCRGAIAADFAARCLEKTAEREAAVSRSWFGRGHVIDRRPDHHETDDEQ